MHIQHISNIRQLPAMRSIHSFHQYHSLIIKYILTLLSFTSFIHSLIHSVIQYSTCKGLIDGCIAFKIHNFIIQLYWL